MSAASLQWTQSLICAVLCVIPDWNNVAVLSIESPRAECWVWMHLLTNLMLSIRTTWCSELIVESDVAEHGYRVAMSGWRRTRNSLRTFVPLNFRSSYFTSCLTWKDIKLIATTRERPLYASNIGAHWENIIFSGLPILIRRKIWMALVGAESRCDC